MKGPEENVRKKKYGMDRMPLAVQVMEDRNLLSATAMGVLVDTTALTPAPEAPAAAWDESTVAGWDSQETPTGTSYMHDSAMSPSGKYIVATFQDGSIQVRNGVTGDVERTLNTGGGRAYYVSIDQHDMAYVSAGTGQNGRIMAIDLTNGVNRWTAVVGDNPGRSTASADGLQLVVDVDNKGALILDTWNGNKLGGSSADGYGGTSVGTDKMTFFKAGSQLWLHEANGTERQLTTLDGLTYDTAATKDGKTVAVGGKGGVIALIDLDSGKETRLRGDTNDVLGLTFLDNHTLAVSHQGGMIDVWDTSNDSTTPYKSFSAGADWVWSMDASEGTLVVRAGGNNPVWRAVHLVDTSPPPTLSPETPPYQQIPNLYDIATAMATHMTSPEAAVIPAPLPETPVDSSIARAEAPEAQAEAMSLRSSQEKVLAPMSARYEPMQGVTGSGTLRLTTPFDHSFVDTPAGLLRFDHIGGGSDIIILKRNIAEWLRSQNGSQPEVTFTVYADAEKTLPIYEMIFVSDGAGGVSLLSSHAHAISASELPAGVESAGIPPTFEVADISGPGIILAVDPGWVGTGTVQFHGLHDNGVFTGTTVTGKEGGGITPVSLSINGSNSTGDYSIMLTGPDGQVSARIRVHWDQATKQLSLLDGKTVWSPGEADQEAMSLACAELHALKNDPASGDRLLGSLQQAVLLDGLKDLPSAYASWLPGADAAYWKTHPDWTDDALRIKAQTGPGSFDPTQAFNALVKTRTDEMRLLRQAYGQYESAMGQLLQQGVSVLAQIRAGGDEFQLRRDYSLLVNQASGSLTMQQLSGIGIHMPTGDQMLEAAKLVWANQWQEQLELKAGESQLAAQEALQSELAARGDFVQNSDGTWMAQNDPRLQQVTYYVDAQGRVTTLASNQVATTNGSTTVANTAYQTIGVDFAGLPPNEGIHSAASIEGVWTYDLELENGEFIGTKNYAVNANKSTEITFTLTRDTMVNFGVPGASLRDVNLTITGDGLPANGYSTPHENISGDSVSLKLTAGTYTLVIKDASNYYMRTPTNFAVPVQMDIQHYNSAKITGMISIEGNAAVMPVSMSVVEFKETSPGNFERKEFGREEISELNPSKPVWVVIHGRGDQGDSGKMTELEKAMFESGYQVVSIDWKDAAGSNIPESAGMQGEAWIQSVADWAFRALKSAGVQGDQVKIGGHSWGSFVGFEIAQNFKTENGFGIDTFVALDSAQDPTLSFRYDASQVDFGAVSKSSTAFWSSLWGDQGRATTALHTVDIRSPLASLYPIKNQTLKHGLAMTTFANLIRLQRIEPSNNLARQFSFVSTQPSTLPSQNGVDAWLFVESFLKTGLSPEDEYIDAIPTRMTFTNPDDASVDLYLFNTLNNVQSTINAY